MEVPLTVGIRFCKGTICRTLKRLKLLDEPEAVACVYLCMCARAISCMVATFLQASYLLDWFCSLAAALSRSLSLPTSPADSRLLVPLRRSRTVLLVLALGVSPRSVSGSVCSKLAVVLLQLCTFRKRCGRCSQVAGVRVDSTEHIMRVHATQGAVPLAWLAQWGCCLPHFVYSALCVDPYLFCVVAD